MLNTQRLGVLSTLVPLTLLFSGCGNAPVQLVGPRATDLDGDWAITADAAGFFLGGCLEIRDGRPARFFDGCGIVDSLLTSKPITFDSEGPIIEFTAFDALSGFTAELTIFAKRRNDDFYDVFLVFEDAVNSITIDGQMERF